MNYVIHALRNPFTYTGRASRAEFWSFAVFMLGIQGILAVLFLVFAFAYVTVVAVVATCLLAAVSGAGLLVLLSLSVRRAHDFGQGGWLALPMLLLPPVFLVCGIVDGHYRTNKYGPRPHALDF
jgi:uncharacterized membrane protein YhaH (DUF805 family)